MYFKEKSTEASIYFPLVDSSDNVSFLAGKSASMVVEISIDGGIFNVCSNTPTELSSTGIYYLTMAAIEMSGDSICIKATDESALDQMIVISTYVANNLKADVSALATEANATTNKTNIITEIDANETKIDTLQTDMSNTVSMVTDIHTITFGRWKIDVVAYTLTLYDLDDTTPLKVFDLKNENELATVENVMERVPQ